MFLEKAEGALVAASNCCLKKSEAVRGVGKMNWSPSGMVAAIILAFFVPEFFNLPRKRLFQLVLCSLAALLWLGRRYWW
ncbi:hypothetical protein SY88_11340 [Clostridiales bacterium PH28_bin88]|nr:hypothetical protein SY88_11340 [Clostridiales bacterium PH28_bin88]